MMPLPRPQPPRGRGPLSAVSQHIILGTWASGTKGLHWLAATLVLLLGLVAAPAFAQDFPKFTGLVTDAANVLPAPAKADLTAKLESLQKETGRQLVVATVPGLQGYDIADYGYRLGRAWNVGMKGVDNGLILLVAPTERKVRVEVGYGLTPMVTDAFSGIVIRDAIVPKFKAGDMPAGIVAGTDALIAQLRLPDAQARAKVAEATKAWDAQHRRATGSSGSIPGSLIFWIVILFVVILPMLRRMGGRRYRGGGGGGISPVILWGPGLGGGGGGSGWMGGGGSSDGGGGGWMGGGFTGGGGGSFGGGGASGSW